MEHKNTEDRIATNIRARDEARLIAQGFGVTFKNVQDMVDDIERKLIEDEKSAETDTKKL